MTATLKYPPGSFDHPVVATLRGCPANPRIYPWEATIPPQPMALAVGS